MFKLVQGAIKCLKAQIRYMRYGKELEIKEVAKRLTICGTCRYENKGVCGSCGCILLEKAPMSTENCPELFWEDGGVPDGERK
jgi:hypothetical protein